MTGVILRHESAAWPSRQSAHQNVSTAAIESNLLAAAGNLYAVRWWPLGPCWAPIAFQRLPDGSKRLWLSLSNQQTISGADLLALVEQYADLEVAIEPPKEADWLGWDIDRGSLHRNPESIATLRAVAEQWGLSTVTVSSSQDQHGRTRGVRVYAFTGEALSRHKRAALAAFIARQAGLTVESGQLELIPQLRDYRRGEAGTQRFTPPFQGPGSVLLEDDLSPGPWGPQESAEITDAIARQADPERAGEALASALAYQQRIRARSGTQEPLEAVPTPEGVALASGASNDGLLSLARRFVRAYKVEPGRERTVSQAFAEWLSRHPAYAECSADTRRDIERGTRASRLLRWALTTRASRGTVPSPNSNAARQAAAFRKLLSAVAIAADKPWRTGREFVAWLVRFHGLSARWCWKPLVRPVWEWLLSAGGERLPSPEYQAALTRFGTLSDHARGGGEPEAKRGEEDHTVIWESRAASADQTDLPPPPVWLEALQELRSKRRESYVQTLRAKRRAEGAVSTRATDQRTRAERRADKAAGIVLTGLTTVDQGQQQQSDADFWAACWQGRASGDAGLGAAVADQGQTAAAAAHLPDLPTVDQGDQGNGTGRALPDRYLPGVRPWLARKFQKIRETLATAAPAPAAPPDPAVLAATALQKAQCIFRWDGQTGTFRNRATGTARTAEEVASIYSVDAAALLALVEQQAEGVA